MESGQPEHRSLMLFYDICFCVGCLIVMACYCVLFSASFLLSRYQELNGRCLLLVDVEAGCSAIFQ